MFRELSLMNVQYSNVLESYLIPTMEGLIKPSKELEEYRAKSINEKIDIWIKYLESKNVEIIKKLPPNVKTIKFFNTISKKVTINDYEMILYTTKKDKDFKNPTKMKLSIKTKFMRKSIMVTYDISIDPKTAEIYQQQNQQFMFQQQMLQNQQNVLQQQMIQQQIDMQTQQTIQQQNQITQMQVQMNTNFGMGF